MSPQWYLDGLDQVDAAVRAGLDADTAYRRRLGLICDLYVSEGGTKEGFLDLMTQAGVLTV